MQIRLEGRLADMSVTITTLRTAFDITYESRPRINRDNPNRTRVYLTARIPPIN